MSLHETEQFFTRDAQTRRGIPSQGRLSDTGDEISGTLVADGNQRLYLFEVKD